MGFYSIQRSLLSRHPGESCDERKQLHTATLRRLAKDPQSEQGCILFYADPRTASEDFKNTYETMNRSNSWGGNEDLHTYFTSLYEGQVGIPELGGFINKEVSRLMKHPSMAQCRSIPIPTLYYFQKSSMPGFDGRYSAAGSSAVNSLVIKDHVFMLEPFDLQPGRTEAIFQNAGFQVHTYSGSAFDSGWGFMHCSTNTVRHL